MKQLIILHSRYLIGGACESIKLLIENIGHPVDLLIPKGEADYITGREIKKFYGKNVHAVFSFYLPCNYSRIEGAECFEMANIQRSYRLFQQNRQELYDFLSSSRYDHIHLNSFGLYPVLSKRFPMTLHMREVVRGSFWQMADINRYLRRARGIVFIDKVTQEPFDGLSVPSVLLPNPVDQTQVNQLSPGEILASYGFDRDTVIFTIVGTISDLKGQEFLIRAFNRFHGYPYKLLIAGDGSMEDKKRCMHLAENNPDIVFLGQLNQKKMLELYSITDYIVRAESFFVITRVVYEGLYSGANLIIQGSEKDIRCIDGYEKFQDRLYSYNPRDEESFLHVLQKLGGRKVQQHRGEANVQAYSRSFNRWAEKVTLIRNEG